MSSSVRTAIRVLAGLALLLLGYCAAHRAAYRSMQREGWLDGWEYLTQKDRDIGFRLRAGISSSYSGVPICVSDDRVRTSKPFGHVPAKAPGELLVLSGGDSNTFGVYSPYERTYSAVLEQLLAQRLDRPVRVVNLGVPGHSLLQTVGLIREWASRKPDVIVVSDSFNNRAFLDQADSAAGFRRSYYLTRPYEFGSYICYPMLLVYRTHFVLPRARQAPVPSLASLPLPRVPPLAFRSLVRELQEIAAGSGAKLVFLVSGDNQPDGVPPMEAGILAFRGGRWEDALSIFEAVRRSRPRWFLPAYYAFQAASHLGRSTQAAAIQQEYTAAYGPLVFRYLDSFANLPSDYVPALQEAAAGNSLAFLDVRQELRGRLVDVSHYDPKGHAIIGAQLASLIGSLAQKSEPD